MCEGEGERAVEREGGREEERGERDRQTDRQGQRETERENLQHFNFCTTVLIFFFFKSLCRSIARHRNFNKPRTKSKVK